MSLALPIFFFLMVCITQPESEVPRMESFHLCFFTTVSQHLDACLVQSKHLRNHGGQWKEFWKTMTIKIKECKNCNGVGGTMSCSRKGWRKWKPHPAALVVPDAYPFPGGVCGCHRAHSETSELMSSGKGHAGFCALGAAIPLHTSLTARLDVIRSLKILV